MKIGYLGAGSWGISLAAILAGNGHEVLVWTRSKDFSHRLSHSREHPRLPHFRIPENLCFTSDLEEVVKDAEVIVESVTSAGVRPLFEKIFMIRKPDIPVILTSKGIEQNTGLLLPEILCELMGEENKNLIGCLSGPSHAEEVATDHPTSVVCSAYSADLMKLIQQLFITQMFRIYPNTDLYGVCFGGAMKNIIAIACGISDGLGFGDNTKAALITRGLHEIRKLSVTKGGDPDTLNGLSGLGDLSVTCLSTLSRNYRFGRLLADGKSPEEAKKEIGMAVEGSYTCVSAVQLGRKSGIEAPISEVIHAIIYKGMNPCEAVKSLLMRTVKQEHL